MSFEAMWRDLAPLGRSRRTGGYRRLPWTSVDHELGAWFAEEVSRRGLLHQRDGFGNQVAWWGEDEGPALLTGSHLDSVADGGGYDGPLGVVSALAAGIPSSMLFVRNPTGVSHAPGESAGMADCLAGVEALASILETRLT